MLITADWVFPVSRPPIRHGAVIVSNDHVLEVGRADELAGLNPDLEHHDFPGCVVSPGLVNAHTHLSLSAMGGLLEPAPFEEWLPRLVLAMKAWSPADFEASVALGVRRSIEAGVTVVGDIVYSPQAASIATREGLGGVFYWEVLGVEAPRLYAELERLGFPVAERGTCGPRSRCGISPHSTYTSGPQLLQTVHETAMQIAAPVAIHVAESIAEVQLMEDGSGPLRDTADRMASGFEVPGTSPVAYLDRLGVLDAATAIHLGQATPADISRLAATARGVVACPRSNRFLSNAVAPVARLLAHGIPVGLGTDSAASNHDLDLMDEARALREVDPEIEARTLVEMVTMMGAIAIGVEDRYGILERGMQADLAVFRIGETADPEHDFVRLAGSATTEAVMTGGAWRIKNGHAVEPQPDVQTAADTAAAKARAALAV